MATAKTWTDKILVGVRLAIQASKEVVTLGLGMSLDNAIETNCLTTVRKQTSEDLIEGPLRKRGEFRCNVARTSTMSVNSSLVPRVRPASGMPASFAAMLREPSP